jgi:hypothetical protein
MDKQEHSDDSRASSKWLPAWFKLSVGILIGLIILKALDLQVFVQIDYDGNAFLTALTEIETYYLPLGLLLVYFLLSWVWSQFFGSKSN